MFLFSAQIAQKIGINWPSFTDEESDLGHKLTKSDFMSNVVFHPKLKTVVAKYSIMWLFAMTVTEYRIVNQWGPVGNISVF